MERSDSLKVLKNLKNNNNSGDKSLKEYKEFAYNLQKIKMLMLSGVIFSDFHNIKPPNKYKKAFITIQTLVQKQGLKGSIMLNELLKIVKSEIQITNELDISISEIKMQIKILKFLPFIGVFFGFVIGANPIKTIFTSLFGLICCFIGAIFIIAGNKWTNNLIHSTKINFDNELLLSISVLKNCYLAGFSNSECQKQASKICSLNNNELKEILNLTISKGISPCEMLDDLYNNIIDEQMINAKKKIAEVNAKLMFPLSACYLPAFIFIGLLPIIISMLQNLKI
jgi:tight adherence protein B